MSRLIDAGNCFFCETAMEAANELIEHIYAVRDVRRNPLDPRDYAMMFQRALDKELSDIESALVEAAMWEARWRAWFHYVLDPLPQGATEGSWANDCDQLVGTRGGYTGLVSERTRHAIESARGRFEPKLTLHEAADNLASNNAQTLADTKNDQNQT